MLARLLLRSLISLVLATLIVGVGGAWAGHPVLGAFAAATILFGYAAVLAMELICLWCVAPTQERPRPTELVAAWCSEVIAAAQVFGWRQPFLSNATPDRRPESPAGRRGVLFVHGLVCNRGFWTPWMRRLLLTDHPFVAIDLEPVFAPIETYADTIENAVERLRTSTSMPPVIVAHSMGGLAVRHWLADRDASSRVHRIITIGTPHHGTWLARFGASSSARQMAIGSGWLQRLAQAEPIEGHGKFTCFYGSCDNVVFPAGRAQLARAVNCRLDRTGHVALAFRDEVFLETLRWLGDPERSSSQ